MREEARVTVETAAHELRVMSMQLVSLARSGSLRDVQACVARIQTWAADATFYIEEEVREPV